MISIVLNRQKGEKFSIANRYAPFLNGSGEDTTLRSIP